jgi:hypothetical protein
MTTRMMVALTSDEAHALAQIAYSEMRSPRDQLRVFLRKEAEQRGLLSEAAQMHDRAPAKKTEGVAISTGINEEPACGGRVLRGHR